MSNTTNAAHEHADSLRTDARAEMVDAVHEGMEAQAQAEDIAQRMGQMMDLIESGLYDNAAELDEEIRSMISALRSMHLTAVEKMYSGQRKLDTADEIENA
jgi:transcription termination factor NusB